MCIVQILKYSLLDSTNNKAKELLAGGVADNTVIWALAQSAGRGQYNRGFVSPAGGLYFSLLVRPDISLHLLPSVTLVVGLALVDCLESNYSITNLKLKWPNDVYVGNKKLAGILVESTPLLDNQKLTLIIGVGVNVARQRIDISRPVVFLREIVSDKIDLETLLVQINENILVKLGRFEEMLPRLLCQWQRYDHMFNRRIVCKTQGGKISGIGKGLDETGRYRLLDSSGILHYVSSGSLYSV